MSHRPHLPNVPLVVVGAGVSGLTCAISLQEAGASITVVTNAPPTNTTSAKAAAIWFPFAANPQERVNAWSLRSWEVFEQLSHTPETGVSFIELIELVAHSTSIPWWQTAIPSYRRLAPSEIPTNAADAFLLRVPLIETPYYLPYLQQRFLQAGGRIEYQHLSTLDDLFKHTPLIVHCAGLGAEQLVQDHTVFPIRGQLLKVQPSTPITQAWTHPDPPLTYIIPRSQDCILGGTADLYEKDLTPNPLTSKEIFLRCQEIIPSLKQADILGAEVGLRPGRETVRLEAERTPKGTILHNYGHGGAGFTLSWGCAEEITQLAAKHLAMLPP